jgi:nucleoside-diphosphate-sugar epimerase
MWRVVNAASEVATIGQIARTVQRLMQSRGGSARIEGATVSDARFEVKSQLGLEPRHTMQTGLVDVLDYFLATQ